LKTEGRLITLSIAKIIKELPLHIKSAFSRRQPPPSLVDKNGNKPRGSAETTDDGKYRKLLQKCNNLYSEGQWKELYRTLEEELPPRALLLLLQSETRSTLASGFDTLFEQVLLKLSCPLPPGTGPETAWEVKFLKEWIDHSSQVPEQYRTALARYIVQRDETEERWIRYSIPYLDQKGFEQPSEVFLARLKALVEVTADDLKEVTPEGCGYRDLKYLSNLTLTLLDGDRYDWAYLNLARLSIGYDDLAACLDQEQQRVDQDEYASWHFEKALPAGAEFSDLDKMIAAQISMNSGNYVRALELLSTCTFGQDHDLTSRYEALLATSHARLKLNEDARGDAGLALSLFEKRIQAKIASNGEKFLACRLYLKLKKTDKAKKAFALIDFFKIPSEAKAITAIAWDLGLQEKISEFLVYQINEFPEDIYFNERYIDYLRNYRFDYSMANTFIEKLAVVDSTHPWISVVECFSALDHQETKLAQRTLLRIPETPFWRDEKLLISGRIALQYRQVDLANSCFHKIGNKKRPDAAYWRAVISAYLNDFPDALELLQEIDGHPSLKEQILFLQGKLYLARGEYPAALAAFDQLPGALVQREKTMTLMHVGKYDEVLKLSKDWISPEACYYQAMAFDMKGDLPAAIANYKSYLSASDGSAGYLDTAVMRFAQLVVHQQNQGEIEWLVNQPVLMKKIPLALRVDLQASLGKWQEVLDLISDEQDGWKENSIVAYERVLAQWITSGEWEKAAAVAEKLESLDKGGKYLDEVLYYQFLARAQGDVSPSYDVNLYRRSKEKTLQIALGLYHQMNKATIVPGLSEKVSLWAEEKIECDEAQMINFIVHFCCLPDDKFLEFVQKHEARLYAIQNDDQRRLIQIVIYLVRGQYPPTIEDVLHVYNKGADSFPLSWRAFWLRFITRYVENDTLNASVSEQLLDQISALEIPADVKLMLFSKQARAHLRQKQELLALHNFERALA